MNPPNTPSSVPPDRGHLLTEQRLDASAKLDAGSITDTLRIINEADSGIAQAVRNQIEPIERVVAMVVRSFESGGRLIYLGAGTSGRLGVLDASECPPTFNSNPDQVVGIIAGGDSALRNSSEHKEDDPAGVHSQLDELGVDSKDTVIGIAAGGTTPFVLGGVEYANAKGASTAILTCTPIEKPAWCDVLMAIETGPEVVTGSTRMRAGTATKMVLNMISTGAMVHTGKVYGHLMVDIKATNDKLRDRAARIISHITNLDRTASFILLDRADGSVKPALVMHAKGLSFDDANTLLNQHQDRLRPILGDPT